MRSSNFLYLTIVLCLGLSSAGSAQRSARYRLHDLVNQDLTVAAAHYQNFIDDHAVGRGYPASIIEDGANAGQLKTVEPKSWVSGFFPGTLWYMYEATRNDRFREAAREWTEGLAANQTLTTTHDLGFMMYCSYGNAYRLTGNTDYRDVVLRSAASLSSRFNPEVGCIKSWDWGRNMWSFPVIVDNMMNLELLTTADKMSLSEQPYTRQAISHADETMKHHFREDYTSYHVVDFDPNTGEVVRKLTFQGNADSSVWARGQAWAIYGYTMMARETGDSSYLRFAAKVLQPYIDRLPENMIPYWDFDDPAIPNAPRDASAAAIVASALLELYTLSDGEDDRYLRLAENMLESLSTPEYLAEPGTNANFILKHATGNKPAGREIDVPLIYADYYFVEALLRYRRLATNFDTRIGAVTLEEDAEDYVVVNNLSGLIAGPFEVEVANFNENLTFRVEDNQLLVTPAQDYFGDSRVALFLEGEDTTAAYAFDISVLAVNDAPEPFMLTHPADGEKLSSTNLMFRWEEPSDSDGDALTYRFQLSTTDWDTVVTNITDPKLRFLGEGVLEGGVYTWLVVASDGRDSTASAAATFTAPGATSTRQFRAGPKVRLYPNPVARTLHLDLAEDGSGWAHLRVYDAAGAERLTEEIDLAAGRYDVDVSGLRPGTYFYTLRFASGYERTGKLVKRGG